MSEISGSKYQMMLKMLRVHFSDDDVADFIKETYVKALKIEGELSEQGPIGGPEPGPEAR